MQPFGDYIIQEFESNNIQCHFFKDSTVQTQTTVAITFNDGKRHFITSLGGLEHFQLSDVQKDLLVDADHIAYRGVWFSERLLSQAQVLLKWIKENSDAKISVDLGYDPLWTREDENSEIRKKTEEKKANLLSCLKYVDFLFGNEVEILHLTESKNLDDGIRKLFSRGVKKIILHQGAKGSSIYILNKGKKLKEFEVHHIPAPKVEIINPVGTGDTYDSILIGFNVKGYDILEAAKFATKGAAFSISHPVGTKIPKHFFETNNEN
jgi:sugar/nucleoside kinase (ribokinase family)